MQPPTTDWWWPNAVPAANAVWAGDRMLRLKPSDVAVAVAVIAVIIGTAREVVSRRLEALVSKGVVANERGQIRIINRAELARMARAADG